MAVNSYSSSDDDIISSINVTPLVDVVLVLLIIFLITAPAIYQSAIKVQLPRAKTGEEMKRSPLNFTITKEGQVVWDKEVMDWVTLGKRLADFKFNEKDEQPTAIISADQLTAHGTVIRLMDTLRQAGVTRFGLNVETGIPVTKSGG